MVREVISVVLDQFEALLGRDWAKKKVIFTYCGSKNIFFKNPDIRFDLFKCFIKP